MHKPLQPLSYEMPDNIEILQAYMNKNNYRRADVRKIRRSLRRLSAI